MMRVSLYLIALPFVVLNLHCEKLFSWLEPSPFSQNEVELYTDKLHYNVKENVIITLKNNSPNPIFLAGCSPFLMADKSDSGWVTYPLYVCVWEGFAKKIDAGKTYQEQFSAEHFIGIHKIYTTIYMHCQEGKPISEAQCQSEFRVISREFIISD